MKRGLVAGAIGLAAWIAGALLVDPRQALMSWLMAWSFAASVGLGALILTLMMNVAGSRWFLMVRRQSEAVAGAMVPLALLFIPVAVGLRHIYPWVDGSEKRPYLEPGPFIVRSVIYFVLFAVTVLLLGRWSRRQEHDSDPALVGRMRTFSAAMLPPVGIALTFGAVDWVMSLTPEWYSSVFGIYYWAGGFVAAIGLVFLVARRGLEPTHSYAMGRLLLAFTIFWTYIAYAQGFIIWIANKPEEVTWYVVRTRGSWGAVAVVLLFAHFAIPFSILLLRFVKYRSGLLAGVAGWILGAHLIDIYWVVMPALHTEGFRPHWLDLAALLAVVGLCAAWSALWLGRQGRVPAAAPNLKEAMAYDASMTAGGDGT